MATGGQDAKFFARGKIQEFRNELKEAEAKDKKFVKRKVILKKIVANITMGNDSKFQVLLVPRACYLLPYFLSVGLVPGCGAVYEHSGLGNQKEWVSCFQTRFGLLIYSSVVYLYLVSYGKGKPDQINFAVQHFLQDCADRNPLIRALAIRTMSYIPLPIVTTNLIDPLRHCLKDQDPYVRKTAAICVAKLYAHDPKLVDKHNFLAMLRDLLKDANPTVVANAVAALTEISERSDDISLKLSIEVANKLIARTRWGQIYILDCLLSFVPQTTTDAEVLAEKISMRLQHANSAVVLTTIKILLYLMNYMDNRDAINHLCKKMGPPLVTLLSAGPEVQYVALRNILLIIQRRPAVLKNDVKVFFCKYNDPIYVKLAKLEIMYRLAREENAKAVLLELQEYASEVDIDFVRKAVRTMGRLAIKVAPAADQCIDSLLSLLETKVTYVVQEAVVVIKDIFRRYPSKYEGIIPTLCENIDALDEPDARAAMVWIIGQYAERIDNVEDLIEDLTLNFLSESAEVQLALLTAVVKFFIKKPEKGKELVPKVLKWATEEVDNPDLRDRGYMYWRLLSTDATAAKEVVLAEKPPISTDTDRMERGALDQLLLHAGTLGSIYHKNPETFIRTSKGKWLTDSPALNQASRAALVHRPEDMPLLPALPKTTIMRDRPPEPGEEVPGLQNRYTEENNSRADASSLLIGAGDDDELDNGNDDDADDDERLPVGGIGGGNRSVTDLNDPYAGLGGAFGSDGAGSSSRGGRQQEDLLL
ncbi:adaptor protein complex AP-1 [Rhizoctonia solani AG-1 IA]|uniref:AP complex subunit beta n=1 Tax=Thanatephorus cucumeris (strain AG1-IA) TaxID=983506 RepID=L8X700_THACA|nr:adaptor protein complex AP-1 [Rhizoctonia solani AG-1 IA]